MMCMAALLSLPPLMTFARCVARMSCCQHRREDALHLLSLQIALYLSEVIRVKLLAACHTAGQSAEDSNDEASVLGTTSLRELGFFDCGHAPCRCCLE